MTFFSKFRQEGTSFYKNFYKSLKSRAYKGKFNEGSEDLDLERLKRASLYTLDDFILDQSAMFIGKDGRRIFKFIKSEDILHNFRSHIDKLLLLSGLYKDEFEEIILPVIAAFIKRVSIVPASFMHHDADCMGLVRHSLNTAIIALTIFHEEGVYTKSQERALNAALILLSLLHDVGKILTDFEVYSLNGELKWQSLEETLDDFAKRHQAQYLAIKFQENRHHKHQGLFQVTIPLILKPQDKIFSFIKRSLSIECLKEDGDLYKYVLKADAKAVAMHSSLLQNLLHLPDFIKANLINDLISSKVKLNTENSEVFLAPFGLIIEASSNYFYELKSYYENAVLGKSVDEALSSQKNFTQKMRQMGVFTPFGTRRIYNYYKIILNEDALYIKGALISLPSLKGVLPFVNTAILGTKMVGLDKALSELKNFDKDSICHLKVIGGATLANIEFENIDLSSIRCYDEEEQDYQTLYKKTVADEVKYNEELLKKKTYVKKKDIAKSDDLDASEEKLKKAQSDNKEDDYFDKNASFLLKAQDDNLFYGKNLEIKYPRCLIEEKNRL